MRLGVGKLTGEIRGYCVKLKRGRDDAETATINNVYGDSPGNDKSPPFLEGRLLYTVPVLDNREQPVRWVTA